MRTELLSTVRPSAEPTSAGPPTARSDAPRIGEELALELPEESFVDNLDGARLAADKDWVANHPTGRIPGTSRTSQLRVKHGGVGAAMWIAALALGIAATRAADPLSTAQAVLAGAVALATHAVAPEPRSYYAPGSWRSLVEIAVRAAVTAAGVWVGTELIGQPLPGVALLVGTVLASVGIGLIRLATRIERFTRRSSASRVVIFGAGAGGSLALAAIASDPEARYRPMAVIDDDISLHGKRLQGIPIVGDRHRLGELAAKGADMLVIAVPSAEGPAMSELFDLGHEHGLDVRTLPPKQDLFDRSKMEPGEIRRLVESDLLGRRRIDTDVQSIAGYLHGKRVMVTGAGGSIGSELCRQLARFEPAELIMLDRDESALHAVQLSIDGQAMLDSDQLVLADIRDRGRMERVFARHQPEVVFHAAALKHLPLLERYPTEALLTNVQATVSLLDLATRFGVERFVNVSSDKAANPISVLGYSKRLSERLTSHYAERTGRNFMSVRFGNVLGSRGSVLTSFHQQILEGRPLTITHPDVARYFMTVEEAVELVIQAGAIGARGDAMVLDMGEPVRIVDVARRLARSSGVEAKIVYTRLRAGEKLVEDLFGRDEQAEPTAHAKISACAVPSLDPFHVDRLAAEQTGADQSKVTNEMLRLCFLEDAGEPTDSTTNDEVTRV